MRDAEDWIMVNAMPKGVNPKLTEEFLLGINDVMDASVWWHDGELRATVVVLEEEQVSGQELQRCCTESLGVHQTPRAITLMRSRQRAA